MKSSAIETANAGTALTTGERLSRSDFLARWDALPALKYAELIGGTVYVTPPMSAEHGDVHHSISLWLGTYAVSTPGCRGNNSSTWYMRDDAPQPENTLRILFECGGQVSLMKRKGHAYLVGAPELAAEVSLSTRAYDLSVKKELYRKAGVQELLYALPEKEKVVWLGLRGSDYVEIKSKGGILRSRVFPGLWLDAKALLATDDVRLLEVLRDGLASPEHAAFVAHLAVRGMKS